MDPLLKAADGGLLGSIEFGVIIYQTRSPFRCVSQQVNHNRFCRTAQRRSLTAVRMGTI